MIDGEIDFCDYFTIQEITPKVVEIEAETLSKAAEALFWIQMPTPAKRITFGCGNKLNCPFVQHHFDDLPAYSVYDISRINANKLETLVNEGRLDIMDVPLDFKLSKKQRAQVDIAQQNQIIIDHKAIKDILGQLEYPLYFLDYETYSYVIPPQDGHRPYQQLSLIHI